MTRVLVTSEVALAVMLVAVAGLTVKSLQQITRQDLGIASAGVLTFGVALPGATLEADGDRARRFVEQFEERLRALPGVQSVGAINMLPIAATGMNGQVQLRDRPLSREEAPIAEFRVITPGYLQTMGITLLAGRYPDARDTAAVGGVVVINETMARMLWPGDRPERIIGQIMRTGFDDGSTWREVIGVVRDVRSRRVDAPPDAETYVPHAQWPLPGLSYTVRVAASPEGLVPLVRRELQRLDPALPLSAVRTFQDVVNTATRSSQLYSVLTGLFGVLAALLAILGIYSVMSYTVAQRTRELAIRSALGASNGGLLQLVLREGFVMSAIGIVLGLVGALSGVTAGAGVAVSGEPDGSVCVGGHRGARRGRGVAGISHPRAPRVARCAGDRAARGVTSGRYRHWPLVRIGHRYDADGADTSPGIDRYRHRGSAGEAGAIRTAAPGGMRARSPLSNRLSFRRVLPFRRSLRLRPAIQDVLREEMVERDTNSESQFLR